MLSRHQAAAINPMKLSCAVFLVAAVYTLVPGVSPAAPADAAKAAKSLPTVLVIATGGTIAGVQDDPDDPTKYRSGSLSGEQIVASVPGLERYARVESLQFSNVPSSLITPSMWIALSQQIEKLLNERDDLAGVVVTHGTDRLEETAFFLYLTVHSDKPVVVVGSQRPATGISPDGPQNLLDAVRTVVSPQAVGKGALVVMDGRILSARDVRKIYQRVGGFSVGDMGMLGVVAHDDVEFFYAPTRPHGSSSEFDLSDVQVLPEVDLRFSYPGGSGAQYANAPAGVVVASTWFTCAETAAYLQLAQAGTIVVSAFPSGDNVDRNRPPENSVPADEIERCDSVDPKMWEGRWLPPISALHLTPQKARILLMLALTRSQDDSEIRRIFKQY